jgi:hypothetical protein
MKFEVYPQYHDYAGTLDLYIFSVDQRGVRSICTSLETMTFQEHDECTSIEKPTMSMNAHVAKPFLQAMADALDKIGVRPTGKPVLENELTATKYHLEDMRKLVFDSPR